MKKLLAIVFLLVCFGIGYFGVQKLEAQKLLWLGIGLLIVGVMGLAIQPQPKKLVKKYSLK